MPCIHPISSPINLESPKKPSVPGKLKVKFRQSKLPEVTDVIPCLPSVQNHPISPQMHCLCKSLLC